MEDQDHVRSLAIDTLSTVAQLHAGAGELDAAIETLDLQLVGEPSTLPSSRLDLLRGVVPHIVVVRLTGSGPDQHCGGCHDRSPVPT
jgi:hypothetical protein